MTLSAAAAVLAALAVGAMGFAIQRGGTCMVAAVDELLSQRRAHRLTALLEASLWVAGGLATAQLWHLAGSMPLAQRIGFSTVAGAAMLGLGAWLNRACVFGAVARLGSGDWAYLLTPLGFFLGCLAAPAPAAGGTGASWINGMGWLAPVFLAFALWRAGPATVQWLRSGRWTTLTRSLWAPHAATVVIGISFVVTLLLAGRWAYTDVLADLAKGMAGSIGLPGLLLLALFAGALAGGWTAGRWRATRPTAAGLLRCLAGGVLMGYGSSLIPGSNDGLILIGIPLLHAHAWLALAVMGLSLAAALSLQARWQR